MSTLFSTLQSSRCEKEFIITLLPILTFFPNTTYGLITTFFPIFVSSEKKIVSGPSSSLQTW